MGRLDRLDRRYKSYQSGRRRTGLEGLGALEGLEGQIWVNLVNHEQNPRKGEGWLKYTREGTTTSSGRSNRTAARTGDQDD